MRLRCAVLDDFQRVATEVADWSPVADEVEVVSFDTHLDGEDALAAALADFDIVVTLRERVPFPGSLIARLPRLKLIVASGMRNSVIDYAAAEEHGVTVCGTASSSTPPVELTWALLLGLARGLVEESNTLRSGGPWQSTVGADLHGSRLGLLGLGKIGSRVARWGSPSACTSARGVRTSPRSAPTRSASNSPPPGRASSPAATSSRSTSR